MGCINEPARSKIKVPKNQAVVKKGKVANENKEPSELPKPKEQKSRYKRITGEQFCCLYNIEKNCENVSKVQGPKFIHNAVDGSVKVLRVIPFGEYDQKRLKAYKEVLQFEILEDDEGSLLIIDEYCCGPNLTQVSNTEQSQKIQLFLKQVYDCIQKFHQKNVILGNLNIFSFSCVSDYDSSVRLLDFNLLQNCDESMGHAHKKGKEVDWEAFGFMVQYVTSSSPPIFLPHKIQYIQTEVSTAMELLKGKKVEREGLFGLKYQKACPNITNGYRFRLDLSKLIRIRKRRNHHRFCYYGEDAIENGAKLNEEIIHRVETSRILNRIETYIEELSSGSEEAFLMFADGNEKYKKFKEVFILKDKNKKMIELKELLPLVR